MGCSAGSSADSEVPTETHDLFKKTLEVDGFLYRVIQEKRAIFWEMIVSVVVRNKSSYEHVSNSEWLPR